MWALVKFLFIIGLFVAITWGVVSLGWFSQGDKKPAASFAAATDFITTDVFSGGGDQVEIIRPKAEPTTKGIGGFFKATTRPATASGAVYQADDGPTTSEEARANWSGYYNEEHKSEKSPGN